MKTALAIVCSLFIAMTPFVSALGQAAGFAGSHRKCCHGCSAKCCAVPSAPESPPQSAAPPAASTPPTQWLSVTALVWLLPDVSRPEFPALTPSVIAAADAPVFARNCSWLI